MSALVRIQRQRTKGWRMPEGAVYVGRPGVFGNPWDAIPGEHDRAVRIFRAWLIGSHLRRDLQEIYENLGPADIGALDARRGRLLARLPELRGKNLACYCPLDRPCHADVLLELANREPAR